MEVTMPATRNGSRGLSGYPLTSSGQEAAMMLLVCGTTTLRGLGVKSRALTRGYAGRDDHSVLNVPTLSEAVCYCLLT